MSRVKSTLRVRAPGANPPQPEPATAGARSVFGVRVMGGSVVVETLLLRADGQLQQMPVVFPSREYALEQIQQLGQIVLQHFDQIEHRQQAPAQPERVPT